MSQQVVAIEEALAFLGPALAKREELREPPPPGAVLWIGKDIGRTIGKDEPGAGRKLEACFLGRLMRPYHAGDRVAVGNADADEAELLSRGPPVPPDGKRRAGTRNWWRRQTRHRQAWRLPASREQSLQEPARPRRLAAVKPLAIEPGPQAVAAFDPEIIARQGRFPWRRATIPWRCAQGLPQQRLHAVRGASESAPAAHPGLRPWLQSALAVRTDGPVSPDQGCPDREKPLSRVLRRGP